MPEVKFEVPITNTNSPETADPVGVVDLALLLSERYGKNIRQGQTFRVTGYSATVRPAANAGGANVDIGVSANVALKHVPTTAHSRKAWNHVFKQWRGQKRLSGKVGALVRNDDMEFAYHNDYKTSRTSHIFGTGIGDSNEEDLVLMGDSTGGADFSLQDFYNSMMDSAGGFASRDHFDNSVIKANKYGGTPFPQEVVHFISATQSQAYDWEDFNEASSSIAMTELHTLPQPHQVMCGLLKYACYVSPEDTATQVQEDYTLVITIFVKSWKPLVYPRRKSSKGGASRKSTGRGRRGGR